ncbi:MAG TPA: hypothetical protein VFF49_05080 [Thermodesulfobacteriota bacterium]|nr:hypothetical protein [Thermodesulfobacteriota bacterium]
MMKKRILFLMVNVQLFTALFIGEIYRRMKGFHPYIRTFPGQYQNKPKAEKWAHPDPLLGWTIIPKYTEIIPQGFRDTKDFNKVDLNSGEIRVMILGDSFMYGVGVQADENVPNLLQGKLIGKYEFFNLGMRGWGIDQMYLAYKKYKDVIDPNIVILAYIDDDVRRVLEAYRRGEGFNKLSFTIENGRLVPRRSMSQSQMLLNAIMEKNVFFSLLMRYIYLIKDVRSVVSYMFLDIAKETQQKKVKFVVVRIPTKDFANYNIISQRLYDFEDLFRGTDVLYLEPFKEIRQIPSWTVDLYLNDRGGHLSEAGNQLLSDYVYRHVFKESK